MGEGVYCQLLSQLLFSLIKIYCSSVTKGRGEVVSNASFCVTYLLNHPLPSLMTCGSPTTVCALGLFFLWGSVPPTPPLATLWAGDLKDFFATGGGFLLPPSELWILALLSLLDVVSLKVEKYRSFTRITNHESNVGPNKWNSNRTKQFWMVRGRNWNRAKN